MLVTKATYSIWSGPAYSGGHEEPTIHNEWGMPCHTMLNVTQLLRDGKNGHFEETGD